MRRKGELSPAGVDRGWPHQVALAESFTVPNFVAISEFCAAERLSLSDRGHSFYRDGEHYNVYCFAEPEHAQHFRVRFGGEAMTPETRPRWNGKKR